MTQPGARKFIFCVVGIFVCFSCFAILQEKITRGTYINGDVTETFTYMLAFVWVQCLVYCLFAKLLLVTVMKQGEDKTSNFSYVTCALTYLLPMYFSNEALQYVNYSTQMVGKATKPISVMILGILLAGKSYPLKKYGIVALVVSGTFLFMYKEGSKKESEREYYGQAMMLLSLIMDGLNGAAEDKIRTKYQTTSLHMMYKMNLWSAVGGGVAILLNGQFFSFGEFLQRHPVALQRIAILSMCGAVGQYFIFMTIYQFGALACSIATTTRKCFTIVVSAVVFIGNPLLPIQWLATVILFLGLFLDAFYGQPKIEDEAVARFSLVRAARFRRNTL